MIDTGEKLKIICGDHMPPLRRYISMIKEHATIDKMYNVLVEIYNEGFTEGYNAGRGEREKDRR